jgi:NAD(P)-dependent dehydrogenase (short-subunit alcohol dehydrogenase family)
MRCCVAPGSPDCTAARSSKSASPSGISSWKLAMPHLRQSQQAAVVIVASDSALVASPLHVPYCASKGAVLMLTKALAVDLRSDGVRVNCVCPSIVDTAMSRADLGLTERGFDTAKYPVQTADDIARYMTLLAAPVTRTISGHPLVADFGYLAESNFPA